MASTKLTIDVRGIPEVIFEVRRQFAEMLRYEADHEDDPIIAKRLRELAADFSVNGLWISGE